MAEAIGGLRVDLAANAAQFASDMAAARGAVVSNAARMKASFASLRSGTANLTKDLFSLRTAMLTGSAAGAVLFIKKMAEMGSEIGDTADMLGISAEKLQEYRYAASQVGVDQETLTGALQKFTRGLGEAAAGTGEARKGLAQLGISVQQIKGMDPTDVFEMVADRLAAITDPAKRARIEVELFGRSGQALNNLLVAGGKGIRDYAAEARSLGLVVDNAMIKRAQDAGDEFDKLSGVFKVAGINLAAEFLPAIKGVAQIMTDPKFQEGVKSFAEEIGKLVGFIKDNIELFERLSMAFVGMRLGGVAGPYGAAAGALAGFLSPEIRRGLSGEPPKRGIAPLNMTVYGGNRGKKQTPAPSSGAPIELPDPDAEKKFADYMAQIRERIASMRLEAETVGLSRAEIERRKMALDLEQEAEKAGLSLTPKRKEQIAQLSAEYANQYEILQKTIEQQQKLEQAANESFEAVKSGFMDVISGASTFEEALSGVLKKLGEIAISNAFDSLFKPSSSGSAGGTFGSIFSGLGKLLGFATGGSFEVGGSGGIDSQLVAFAATPGEMVNVTKGGQGDRGGSADIHVVPSPYFEVVVDKRAAAVAQPIAAKTTQAGLVAAGKAQQRRQVLAG